MSTAEGFEGKIFTLDPGALVIVPLTTTFGWKGTDVVCAVADSLSQLTPHFSPFADSESIHARLVQCRYRFPGFELNENESKLKYAVVRNDCLSNRKVSSTIHPSCKSSYRSPSLLVPGVAKQETG